MNILDLYYELIKYPHCVGRRLKTESANAPMKFVRVNGTHIEVSFDQYFTFTSKLNTHDFDSDSWELFDTITCQVYEI